VIVPVGVTYGTPAREVIDLLVEVARANPDVIDDPAPYGLFTGFGDSSLDFELRAWTESGDAMTIVRSDLAVGIQDALAAANIEVPFPQRDLHVKAVPAEPSAPPETRQSPPGRRLRGEAR
jgi:small-conductance mechanosensitive channel